MNIECPHCNTTNTLEFADNIRCHKCENNFVGFSFRKYKTSIKTATGLILFGAFGGQYLDSEYLEAKRYPSAAIYEIISYCSNPSGVNLTRSMQQVLTRSCTCALDKTMPDVSGKDLKRKSPEFVELFSKNLKSCR
ncbi:hypothetical protein LMJ53_16790 [Rheinheimera sp. UJ51]|uniref:hypothetical protein n=1 Tax=Rheinheimera sp. UJ51 TaxID=2892446 RepID=UPI001E2FC44E|nr:hypothetical protein [Rheinheimera sp. UJ51]MCC5453374.1 hypothetical protein [Rheinheimera sp. UJ51]